MKLLYHIKRVTWLMAAAMMGSAAASAQDTDDTSSNPVEFYIYVLNDEGTEIEGRSILLGTELTMANSTELSGSVQLPHGCKFTLSTDGTATTLAQLEGTRRYPASADASQLEMFKRVFFTDEPVADAPAYFQLPQCTETGYQPFNVFMARADKDWSTNPPTYQHRVVEMLPGTQNIKLMVRPKGSTEEYTAVDAQFENGSYRYKYAAPSASQYEFYYTFTDCDGTQKYVCAPNANATLSSLNKPGEGQGFQVTTSLTDQDGSSLVYTTPALVEGDPYEFYLDMNQIDQWTNHCVYVCNWISEEMDATISLESNVDVDFDGDGQLERVHVEGTYGTVNVPINAAGTETKTVDVYRFDLPYILLTPGTQNYFYFKVAYGNGTDAYIVPSQRQDETVGMGYENAITATTYDSDNVHFFFPRFETGKSYTFLFEPATGKVWTQEVQQVTGITAPDAETSSEPAEYYDLQGRRLSHPAGLCIERRGAKATKVIVRP